MILGLLFALMDATNDSRVEGVFRAFIGNIAPHGNRFRKAVYEAFKAVDGQSYPTDADDPISTPYGDSSYRVISTLNCGPQALIVHREGSQTIVKALPAIGQATRPVAYAISLRRVFVLSLWAWSGEAVEGDVYEPAPDGWKHVQSLPQHFELSMQGYNLSIQPLRDHAGLQIDFTDHEWLEGFYGGSHFSPGLKYREQWLFTEGVLRQTNYYRIETPMASLYDLTKAVLRHDHSAFDARVAPGARRKLWAYLAKRGGRRAESLEDQDKVWDPDDAPDLIINNEYVVHFARHARRWIVTRLWQYKEPDRDS